jgi:ATP-binding cassette, subfamily B, bacterial
MWGMGSAVTDDDRLDRGETRRVLGRAFVVARPHRRHLRRAASFVLVSTLVTLSGPIIVRFGIDRGISADRSDLLNAAVVAYLVVVVIGYLAGRQQYLAVNRAGEGFLRDLRVLVFDRLLRQSMAFYDREKAGVLVSRMTADIESMAELIQWGLLQFVSAGLLLLLAFVLLFVMSWQLTLVALLVFPILAIASIRFQRQSNAAYLVVRDRVGTNLSSLQEGISGARVIQAYGREDEQVRRFVRSNRALYDAHMHSVRVSTWYFGLVEAAGIVSTALLIGVGGWMVHTDRATLGTVAAFVLVLSNLFEPVQQLSQLYNTVQSAAASLNKIFTLVDTLPDVGEADGAVELPTRGELAVGGVSFYYAGTERMVLADIDLVVADGERIALVGPTGAGKSTLAKLMARLYDPTEGSVVFGGIDLRQASLASLRSRIVVVPQEGYLFGGDILENVRIARPSATDDDVRRALADIGALERFSSFPEGLHTEVRERGSRLSAGERQLVSLARAALVDPGVLVLDEATSNLDPGTEAVVERALDTLMSGRTTIVVAHRLSTVRRADRIVVIDDGRMVEVGSHDELVGRQGRYAALAEAWERSRPRAG